jgi:NAD(P)-dependent dehydrogenase (short-subunit alcohol dehydrogenase family)
MRLEGKTALITGGASGIGLGFAHAVLAQHGNVAIVDIHQGRGNTIEKELAASVQHQAKRVKFFRCDVTDSRSLAGSLVPYLLCRGSHSTACYADVLAHFGAIHVVLNSAVCPVPRASWIVPPPPLLLTSDSFVLFIDQG